MSLSGISVSYKKVKVDIPIQFTTLVLRGVITVLELAFVHGKCERVA